MKLLNENFDVRFKIKKKNQIEEKIHDAICHLVISFKILISRFASIQLNSKVFPNSKIIFPNFSKEKKNVSMHRYLYFSFAIFIRAKKKNTEKRKKEGEKKNCKKLYCMPKTRARKKKISTIKYAVFSSCSVFTFKQL